MVCKNYPDANVLMLMIDVIGVLAVVIQLFITYTSAIVMYRYRSYKSSLQTQNSN